MKINVKPPFVPSSGKLNSKYKNDDDSDEQQDSEERRIQEEDFQRRFQEAFREMEDPSIPSDAQSEPDPNFWNSGNGKVTLFPFQKYGLAWMLNREKIQKINFNSNNNGSSGSLSALTTPLLSVPVTTSFSSNSSSALTKSNLKAFSQQSNSNHSNTNDTQNSSLLPQRRTREEASVVGSSSATEVESATEIAKEEKENDDDDDDDKTVIEISSNSSTELDQEEIPPQKQKSEKQKKQSANNTGINNNNALDESRNTTTTIIKQVTVEDFTRFFWRRNIPTRPGEEVTFTHELTGERRRQHPILPRSAILGDDLGLGKTMSISALLSHPVAFENNHHLHFPGGRIPSDYYDKHTTLIVAPASLLGTWERHCLDRLFKDKYQVFVVHASRTRPDQIERFLAPQMNGTAPTPKRTIIITTYQTLANEFKRITPPEILYPPKEQNAKNRVNKKNKEEEEEVNRELMNSDDDDDDDDDSSSDTDDDDDSTTDDILKIENEKAKEQQIQNNNNNKYKSRNYTNNNVRIKKETTNTDDADNPKYSKQNPFYDPKYRSTFYTHYFSRIILDEAHMIKNPNAIQSRACCGVNGEVRWAVTGTPVQNHLRDLHSLLVFLRIYGFENKKIWKTFISDPFAKANVEVVTRLRYIIQRVCLRRTKADFFQNKPLLSLPRMTIKIVKLDFSPQEQRGYGALFDVCRMKVKAMKRYLDVDQSVKKRLFMAMLVMLLRCRQFTTDYRMHVRFAQFVRDGMFNDEKDQSLMSCIPDSACRERLRFVMKRSKEELRKMANERTENNSDDEKLKSDHHQECESSSTLTATTTTTSFNQSFDNSFLDFVDELRVKFEAFDDECPICLSLPEEGAIMLDGCHHIMCESCFNETFKKFSVCQKCHSKPMVALIARRDIESLDRYLAKKEEERKAKRRQKQLKNNNNHTTNSKKSEDEIRQTQNNNNFNDDDDDDDDENTNPEPMAGTKCKAVFDYLLKNVLFAGMTQKCVIFSCWPAMLHLLLDYLHYRLYVSPPTDLYDAFQIKEVTDDLEFAIITGAYKIEERQNAVDKFQSNPNCRLMLVSTLAGGTGLTLTKAQHCIMVDPFWNPAVDKQAIMRVHRISQINPVTVVRFFVNDSVDERIMRLQIRKQKLVNLSIDAGRRIAHEDVDMLKQLEEAFRVPDENDTDDDDAKQNEDGDERDDHGNKKKNGKKSSKKKKNELGGGGINFKELVELFR